MAAGYAYISGSWVRITGSDLQLGTGYNNAARGDHGHNNIVYRVVYTSSWPARPTGATYVEWVGPSSAPPSGAIAGDTWTLTNP